MFKTLIEPAQLALLLDGGEVTLFDCGFELGNPDAGRAAFLESHLPGARHLHLDDDLAAPARGDNGRHPLPDPAAFAEVMRANGVMRGRQVIAYDASGGPYAARLWWLLRWLGHDQVAVLNGGRKGWEAAGGPMESGAAGAVARGDFTAAPRSGWTVSAETIEGNIAVPVFTVLDARSASRFAGEPNPMDPVAGHIPGARNRFYGDNLDGKGRFKPAAILAEDFDAVLGEIRPSDPVMQCGSGVTACHNLLALEIAGHSGARLYPGSWSEWISDARRPVERG
ncbi:MAG: 3-mercaptopyruvate sulfurtransferase [Sphingomonas bacterium]|uniref:sulfurtransferase n=1 Tax=Sphingomonas bacterium TaxID=1895847 RepID=UPI0026241AE0|nr:sulfurtransferase [Sphingomonas bacterium]MDB5709656.1 3-mercaptopyruvate sulfurtransferase [Sphingomonas bacterium]